MQSRSPVDITYRAVQLATIQYYSFDSHEVLSNATWFFLYTLDDIRFGLFFDGIDTGIYYLTKQINSLIYVRHNDVIDCHR